ncbi:MAG: thiamine pyrophosphate-dependent enzyme [Bacteriovoracaceae bacterium]
MMTEILSGNELIVRGGLEAGFSLYTGYPGSPLADFFNILYDKRKELQAKGIKVVIGNSEANAAAMASGAKQAGRDVLVGMKSMGLHVASDALSVGNFANPGPVEVDPETGEQIHPGVVIVVGDDPWSISTSTPADSRYLYKHLHIPFFEPSTPQELKDWIAKALYVSKRTSVYQGILLTTFMAEGGGRVELGQEVEVDPKLVHLNPEEFDLSKNVMVPPNSLLADGSMINERFPKVHEVYKQLGLDKTFGEENSDIGFISSGATFETLKQVLDEANYLGHVKLYKLASSYPLVDELLLPWLSGLKSVVVVEEKRGFLENELSELIVRNNLDLKVYGKSFNKGKADGFPANGGLNYEIVQDRIAFLLSELQLGPFSETNKISYEKWEKNLPRRLPTFCPGCPHRETLSLLKDLRKTLKKENIDLITHGDVGCYSLSFLPPFKEMHNLSAMGQGGALGAGVDFFTTNPSVILMGDSTFFHSGMTDISNSVQSNHDITYILLDNDNTAMTGHQMTPVSGVSVEGYKRPRQEILPIVRNLGVDYTTEINPSDRYFYKNLLIDVVKKPGVKVIVSNKECGLTFHGRKKREERKIFSQGQTKQVQSFFQINTGACEDCRECIDTTGCPGLSQTFDAYGTKVVIDPQICVSDSYCTKIKVCPSFEEVEVFEYHPTKYKNGQTQLPDLEVLNEPLTVKGLDQIATGDDWRVIVTGVGGSGVTTITRVLAQAAKEMDGRNDLDFKFVDQKGLAQRNGRVTGHMAIFKKGKSYGAITPMGTGDLLLSPDLLDGSSAFAFLSAKGNSVLDEQFQVPLSILLDRGEEQAPLSEESLRASVKEKMGDKASLYKLKKISYELMGKNVYASAMILGVAYQKGLIPFTLKNMMDAISQSITASEVENNIKAFQWGRLVVHYGVEEFERKFMTKDEDVDVEKYLKQSLVESFLPWLNKKPFLNRFDRMVERLCEYFPQIPRPHLAQYIHDIMLYDRGVKLTNFIKEAGEIAAIISDSECKELALRTLAKTYFIKDEVFIAHQMIGPLKKYQDQQRYSSLGTGFKVKHINRPSFDFFGRKFEFDLNPKDWMLGFMRHARLLRVLLPGWHNKERKIAKEVRKVILGEALNMSGPELRKRLIDLDNIKGYREVRYEKAAGVVDA